MNTDKVTRVEVIDHRIDAEKRGRILTIWQDGISVELELQDDGKTLKIFVSTK